MNESLKPDANGTVAFEVTTTYWVTPVNTGDAIDYHKAINDCIRRQVWKVEATTSGGRVFVSGVHSSLKAVTP